LDEFEISLTCHDSGGDKQSLAKPLSRIDEHLDSF
jgi:hypothetical protein